ncbi:MAG: toll/interleukin-1 receptor domain-containing protein [Gloeobacteraceae cyanobacterium ES-bin-316]|nr:toll/interleukin-1 receptor domain-containing protein [Ferruginibacter sp.]
MAYLYDVFISYKRGKINEQWLQEIFFPFFKEYLNNALPHEPKIFIDTTALTPGVDFSNEIFRNLMYSKCMVSIWSPPYFRRSEWCVKEFLTMKYKQDYHKLSADTLPRTLIWPILYREMRPLPELASQISYLDYSEFNVVGEAFFRSDKFIKFQEKLQADISSIVDIINHVPDIDPAMETAEGKTNTINALKQYFEGKVEQTELIMQNPISW